MNIFEQYLSCGLSVIPCEEKRPLFSWKKYQTELPLVEDVKKYSASQIACVCGAVSGGLICIDFDIKNGDKYQPWLQLINEQYPALLSKLVIEQSPSGGFHAIFKSTYKIGNVKLAVNPENKCTIETRGEGGYFVCAPSPGYVLQFGSFSEINTLSNEETEILITCAKSLNERMEENTQKESEAPRNFSGLSPFDDYNTKHDIKTLLQSHGWKLLFEKNGASYFQRPGKQERSIGATWNVVPERFYVFTTSTCFENQHIYKPSAVYAMLEHGGNYNEAAKELYAKGYGKIEEKNNSGEKKQYKVALINPSSMTNKIYDIIQNGYQRGKTTGWNNLDKLYSVIKGQFTVITGMPSHGKSEFMDALAINLMAKDNWKFAVFSPENYPPEMHYHKLIEKITGQPLQETDKESINAAIKAISEYFYFIDALEEDIDLDAILGQTEILIKEKCIDGLIIDPWNEIELSKPRDISDSDFIGVCLRRLRKFSRKHKIHLWVICHPTKMQKNKDGKYDVPELYDCAGSAHWRNKADNGICVHRDMEKELTEIHVQKVKFRYAGKPGTAFLKYNERCGRYDEANTVDDFENRY